MNRGAKIFLWILALVVVVAAFGWQARQRLQKDEVLSIEDVQAERGIPVDVIRARAMRLEDWRSFTGVAEGWEQVDIMSDFRTRVEGVHVKLGQRVAAGTVLVSLDPDDPGRAGLNRETAQVQYATMKADSLRMEALFAQGAVSQQRLDSIRARTTAARVALNSAMRLVELDTPVAGVVTALHAEAGQYVDGTVATVSDYDRLRVPLSLSAAERARVKVGQAARLRLEDGSFLEGQVSEVSLSADSATRLYAAELVLENPGHRLHPGSLVSPEILVDSSENLPLLPREARVECGQGDCVYVVVGDTEPRASRKAVKLGADDGLLAAVTAGISEGETVVVAGQNKLEEGSLIHIRHDLSERYYGAER